MHLSKSKGLNPGQAQSSLPSEEPTTHKKNNPVMNVIRLADLQQ